MVVKIMRNRTVFVLVALITVIAGGLFVSTSDTEAAKISESVVECPVGVEVPLVTPMPTTDLVLFGNHPVNTSLSYNVISGQPFWTLTFTPDAVKTYEFGASDPQGNAWNVKLISTDPNDRESVDILSGELFSYQLRDPLYKVWSIREGADWLSANDGKLRGTAPIVDHATVFSFLVEGKTSDTTAYRYVDMNVIPSCEVDIIQSYGGIITPSDDFKSPVREKHTFEFKANSGFGLADVLIDGLSDPSAVRSGKYTLEAVKGKHTVTAIFSPLFSVNVGSNGSVFSNGSTLINGENSVLVDIGINKQFVFVPDHGYRIDKVELNGVNNTAAVKNGSHTFSNVQSAQSLNVTFVKADFNITIEQKFGETIIFAERMSVQYNTKETISFIPPLGYSISEILIDGVKSVTATTNKEYMFTVTKDISFVVNLVRLSYSISCSVSSGYGTGTIDPEGTVKVLHGDDRTFNITPAEGYRISSVKLNFVTLESAELEAIRASGKYILYNITENRNISVNFTKIEHSITIITDGNGTVNGKSFDISKVLHGAALQIRMVPGTGYSIRSISVDGVHIDENTLSGAKASKTYTLNGVQGSQTVMITFEKVVYKITTDVIGDGVVSPDSRIDAIEREHGSSATLKFTPGAGYIISSVQVDGSSLNAAYLNDIKSTGTYEIKNITGDRTIKVTFTKADLTITVEHRFEGNVISTKGINAHYDTKETVVFAPSAGYGIYEIWIDGVKSDIATINKKYEFTVTKDISVVVELTKLSYSVSYSVPTGGGSISTAEQGKVLHGNDRTFDIRPSTGYRLSSVSYAGSVFKTTQLSEIISTGKLCMENITSDIEISVSFKKINYTVSITTTGGSSGTTIKTVPVPYLDHYTLQVIPETGYWLADLKVDGRTISYLESVRIYKEHVLYSVKADVDILIVFEMNAPKITVSQSGVGTVTPNGVTEPAWGGDHKFEFYTEEGYYIEKVLVDGKENGKARTEGFYVFEKVKIDHELHVVFARVHFNIILTKVVDGKMMTERIAVEYGSSKTIEIDVADGHHISSVFVDNVKNEKAKNDGYVVFDNVMGDHDINVIILEKKYPISSDSSGNGSVSSFTEIKHGGDVEIRITPETGNVIRSVTVNDRQLNDMELSILRVTGTYKITNIEQAQHVNVIFEKTAYTINFSATGNGKIDSKISGTEGIYHGGTVVLSIVPDEGHFVKDIVTDGKFLSSDELAYAVTNGLIFHDVTENHVVIVTFERTSYIIKTETGENGTVFPHSDLNDILVQHGDRFTLNIRPEHGYRVVSFICNGAALEPSQIEIIRSTGKFSIGNVTADVLISLLFERIPHTISFSSSEGGNVNGTASGSEIILQGDDVLLSIIPADGFRISEVKMDGSIVTDLNTIINEGGYRFTNVIEDHVLTVIFERIVQKVIVSSEGNGTVSPGTSEIEWKGRMDFEFRPMDGHYVKEVLVDGKADEEARMNGSVTFEMVRSEHTLHVIFAKIMFSITIIKETDGMSATEEFKIGCRESIRISFEPDEGHIVMSVLLDGAENEYAAADGFIDLDTVIKDHEIRVSISRKEYTVSLDALNNGMTTDEIVRHGDDLRIDITPSVGNVVRDIVIDGHPLNDGELGIAAASGYFVLTNITQDHKVNVVFEKIAYVVKFSSFGKGMINSVAHGEEGTYHGGTVILLITPNEGYHVKDIVADGTFLNTDELLSVSGNGYFSFSDIIKDHSLSVTFERTSYSVKMNSGENGTVSPDGTANDIRVYHGDEFSMCTYPKTGYRVAFAEYNGAQMTAVQTETLRTSGKLTIGNITSDVQITVHFEKIPYVVSFSSEGSGNINGSASGKVTVLHGENVKLSVVPADGFRISEVKVNGTAVDRIGIRDTEEYDLINVTEDHELTVVFERIVSRISVTSTDGGTVSPGTVADIIWKGYQNFEFYPANGHYVKNVYVDGKENAEARIRCSYFFNNVQEDHALEVVFAKKEFSITVSKDIDGKIETERLTAEYGETKKIDLGAAEGYDILSVFVDLIDDRTAISNGLIEFTDIKEDHTVSIVMKMIQYDLTLSFIGKGTVASDKDIIHYGTDVTITISPKTGNTVSSVTVNGVLLTDDELNIVKIVKRYTLPKVVKDHSIEVIFEEMLYCITYSSGEHGKINTGTYGKLTVVHGNDAEFSITPDEGYRIESINVNGVCLKGNALADVVSAGKFMLSSVTEDHSIIASFVKRTYTVTAGTDGNGSIVPNNGSGITVYHGEGVKFTFTPDPGYRVSDIIVNGISDKDNMHTKEYEIQNVNADQTIEVIFEKIVLNILFSADANGVMTYVGDKGGLHTVSSDPIERTYGDVLEVIISPSAGYRLKSITENGKELSNERLIEISASGKYVLPVLTEDVEITVSFERDSHIILVTVEGSGALIGSGNIVTRSSGASVSRSYNILSGDDAAFEIIPSAGYCIRSITISGKELNGEALETVKKDLRCVFPDVENDNSIEVKFKKRPFIVSSTVVGSNGSISKEGITDVQYGDSIHLEFYPDKEYKVKEVIINGESNRTAAENGYYTLDGIQNDISVLVSYESIHSSDSPIGLYALSIICIAAFAVLIYGLTALHRLRKLSWED
jgi:hypothetical protein